MEISHTITTTQRENQVHNSSPFPNRRSHLNKSSSQTSLPPVDGREESPGAIKPSPHSYTQALLYPSSQGPMESLRDHLWSHPFYKRLIGPLHPLEGDGLPIAEAIRDGSLLACCDGSFSPMTKKSSHGWVLATQTTNRMGAFAAT